MSLPFVRGWHQHPDDPPGVQRWFDGTTWTGRTTGGSGARPAGSSDPAMLRGWHHKAGDPDGVDRWFDGRTWTDRTSGGTRPTPAVRPELDLPRGWHHRAGDPDGVQRWFDGTTWTERTTGGSAPLSEATPSRPRGWHQDPEDPVGVQRWWDGVAWTSRVTGGSAVDRDAAAARPVVDASTVDERPGPVGFTAATTIQTEPQFLTMFPHGAVLRLPRYGDVAACGDPDYFAAVGSDGRPAAVAGEAVRGRWRLGSGAADAAANLGGRWFGDGGLYEGLVASGTMEILILDDGIRGSVRPGQGSARLARGELARMPAATAYAFWIRFSDLSVVAGGHRAFGLTSAGFELWARDARPVEPDGTVRSGSRTGDLSRRVLFGVAEDYKRSAHPTRRAFGETLSSRHGLERFDGRSVREISVGLAL